jgi:hypothetical protein
MKVVYRTCVLTRLIYCASGIGWVPMQRPGRLQDMAAHRSVNPDTGHCRQKLR